MKIALVILLSLSVAFGDEDKYTTKFDSVDIDEILKSPRLLKSYLDCLLNTPGVTCTPEGKELKDHIPEALENGCQKCSEKQKQGIEKVVKYMTKNDPENWEKLVKIYDHDDKFMKKYAEELEKIKA